MRNTYGVIDKGGNVIYTSPDKAVLEQSEKERIDSGEVSIRIVEISFKPVIEMTNAEVSFTVELSTLLRNYKDFSAEIKIRLLESAVKVVLLQVTEKKRMELIEAREKGGDC